MLRRCLRRRVMRHTAEEQIRLARGYIELTREQYEVLERLGMLKLLARDDIDVVIRS